MGWNSGKKEERTVLGRIRIPGERLAAKESRWKKRGAVKEERVRERALEREEKLKRLQELRAPERQELRPRAKDGLNFLPVSQFAIIVGCILIFILGLFTLNYLAQAKNQLGAEVSQLTREQQRLKEANGHLKAKLERLVVLEDLEVIARESLGLAMPQTGQIIVLE